MNTDEFFKDRLAEPSDIGGHLIYMAALAEGLVTIVEFGVRGGDSTAAWLKARPAKLYCYDIAIPERLPLLEHMAKDSGIMFHFTHADTSKLDDIPECDLLFLDTLHTGQQLEAELKHHARVRRFIVMHDTETNRTVGEGGEAGLQGAIEAFLVQHNDWSIYEHFKHCNGLTILERKSP